MKNYEKLIELIKRKDAEITLIREKYVPLFEELKCDFSIEEIEKRGWKAIGFYGAGNEFVYEKNGKKVCVLRGDWCRVLLRDNIKTYPIYDYEHLEDYANGIVYSEVKFYCYYTTT